MRVKYSQIYHDKHAGGLFMDMTIRAGACVSREDKEAQSFDLLHEGRVVWFTDPALAVGVAVVLQNSRAVFVGVVKRVSGRGARRDICIGLRVPGVLLGARKAKKKAKSP